MQYKHLASIYDTFIGVDYEQWSTFISKIIDKQTKTLLELGCGTGKLTTLLANKYKVIAVDNSPEMLMQAREKNKNIMFLEQDMSQLILHEKVDACVSTCDSINYLIEPEELIQTFENVYKYLKPNGFFIFDINTVYKYQEILSDNSFSYTDEKAAVIWDNTFDEESQINEYFLTIFELEENNYYSRKEESHYQMAYTTDFIKQTLSYTGFELVHMYDNYLEKYPKDTTERIVFVAKKKE